MFPQSGGLIVGAHVGLHYLTHCVIPILAGLLLALEQRSGLAIEGQTHEDTVQPHLIGIDSFVPINAFFSAGLVLQLLEEGLHGLQNAGLRLHIIHSQEEVTRPYVV